MQLEIDDFDPDRRAVLCLHSLQFNRDIAVLQERSTKYIWPALPDTFLTDTQTAWMPERARVQTSYLNESGPDMDAAWAKSKRFAVGILTGLMEKGMKLTAVMGGNWDYWAEECMRLACAELGLPFLVLLREHYLAPNRLEAAMEYYQSFPRVPEVAGIAVAGPTVIDLAVVLGLFPASKLRATGWPRLDVWRYPVAPRSDRPVVLMAYLKGYSADEHFIKMLGLFSIVASRFPQVPFVVKAKNPEEATFLQGFSDRHGLGLTVVDTWNLQSLLCNARAVIGFQSVTLYEALLSPARILIPRWGQTEQDPLQMAPAPTDERLRGHMEFLTSKEALIRAIEECVTSDPPPVDMTARRNLFGAYFTYTADISAVERVEQFVDDFGKR